MRRGTTEQQLHALPTQDGDTLLRRYRETGDRRLREQAVRLYMPLARRLAARYHRGREPLDDLTQVAYLGLLKAIDRYEPARGTRFSSFATPTIAGELRRHFRDTTWTLHVPRGVQEATLAVARSAAELSTRLGRAPTVGELAERTGLRSEQVDEALHARSVQETTSLDQPRTGAGGAGDTVAEMVGREDARFELVDRRVTAAPSLRALSQREREILFLRFGRGLTQTEIAARVGCSQMQVSRLLRQTLGQLARACEDPAAAYRPSAAASVKGSFSSSRVNRSSRPISGPPRTIRRS